MLTLKVTAGIAHNHRLGVRHALPVKAAYRTITKVIVIQRGAISVRATLTVGRSGAPALALSAAIIDRTDIAIVAWRLISNAHALPRIGIAAIIRTHVAIIADLRLGHAAPSETLARR